MTLSTGVQLIDADIFQIVDEIELCAKEFKATKSRKTKKELSLKYEALVNSYTEKTGNKNIFHKSLDTIKD